MTHGGKPQAALIIDLDIHNDQVIVVRITDALILERVRIDAATSVAIGSNPDPSVVGLGQGHHRRGIALRQMAYQMTIRRGDINTILIGTDPRAITTVDKHTNHTSGTRHITTVAQLIAHILESIGGDGLAVDALLEHTQPQVAVIILDDRIDLTLREVHLLTEEGIIGEGVVSRIVNGHTLAVVAHDDAVITVAVE